MVEVLGRGTLHDLLATPSHWDASSKDLSMFGAVEMAVAYGREHLDLSEIQSLGIDEIALAARDISEQRRVNLSQESCAESH